MCLQLYHCLRGTPTGNVIFDVIKLAKYLVIMTSLLSKDFHVIEVSFALNYYILFATLPLAFVVKPIRMAASPVKFSFLFKC